MKPFKNSAGTVLQKARVVLALIALSQSFFGPLVESAKAAEKPANKTAASIATATPIKHVIVIVGENRSFDHLFATYVPKPGNSVNNLLSEGIVNPDGSPGPNYSKAVQHSADITGSSTFELAPTSGKAPYGMLPAPLNGGPTDVCTDHGLCNIGQAHASEQGLPVRPINYYQYMLTGGTGLTGHIPDSRITTGRQGGVRRRFSGHRMVTAASATMARPSECTVAAATSTATIPRSQASARSVPT